MASKIPEILTWLTGLFLSSLGPLFCQTMIDRFLTLSVIHKDATIYYILRGKQARGMKTSLKLKSNILSWPTQESWTDGKW